MEANGVGELVIHQRRMLLFLCGAVLLCIGLVFEAVPVLTFFIPIEASYEERLGFRIASFAFALVLGVPIVTTAVFAFINTGYKIAIRANEEGIFVRTDAFKNGFISWTAIVRMHFNKSYMTKTFGRTLELILNTDEKPAVDINAFWRLQSNALHAHDGPRLLLTFSFCKGGARKNAQQIIDLWEAVRARQGAQTDCT